MDEKTTAEAKQNLLRMRRDVLQEVEDAKAASQALNDDGVPDIGDMSSATYNRDVLFNLGEVQRRKIREIDAALERLAKGEYGICLRCEEEIPPRRMQVRPFSRYCVECKAEVEQFGE